MSASDGFETKLAQLVETHRDEGLPVLLNALGAMIARLELRQEQELDVVVSLDTTGSDDLLE